MDFWTDALFRLLDRDPALAQDVMALATLRTGQRPDVVVQVNSATGSGEVFAVQHGDQHFASGPRSRDREERP